MQMHSSDTVAGCTTCEALPRMAASISSPFSRCRLMFSIFTVASSTRMPTARARPPRVMMLMVSPRADSAAMAARIDSGIEMVIISVERQLPRNSRIITPVRDAAMRASRTTVVTALVTKPDWSPAGVRLRPGGRVLLI